MNENMTTRYLLFIEVLQAVQGGQIEHGLEEEEDDDGNVIEVDTGWSFFSSETQWLYADTFDGLVAQVLEIVNEV